MKEKILAFLKGKLNGVPTTFLDGVADDFSKTITEEAQIETVISDGVISSLKFSSQFMQQDGDKRATDAAKTAVQNFREKFKIDENGKPITTTTTQTTQKSEGGNEEIEGLKKQLGELNELLAGVVKTQSNAQKLQSIKAKLLEKGVLEDLVENVAKSVNLDAEDVDAEIENAYGNYDVMQKTLMADQVKKGNYKPGSGSGASDSSFDTFLEAKESSESDSGFAVREV